MNIHQHVFVHFWNNVHFFLRALFNACSRVSHLLLKYLAHDSVLLLVMRSVLLRLVVTLLLHRSALLFLGSASLVINRVSYFSFKHLLRDRSWDLRRWTSFHVVAHVGLIIELIFYWPLSDWRQLNFWLCFYLAWLIHWTSESSLVCVLLGGDGLASFRWILSCSWVIHEILVFIDCTQ